MSIWSCNEVPNLFRGLWLLALASTVYAFNLKPITWFIKISYLTGQILVDTFLTVCFFLKEASKSALVVFHIIYKDAFIFLEDAREKVVCAYFLLINFYYFLCTRVTLTCAYCHSFVETVFAYAISVTKAVTYICNLISTTVQWVQYLGTYTWEVFISIPKILISYVDSVLDSIENFKNEMFNRILFFFKDFFQILQSFYLSFFDIDVESICGLFIASIFLIVFCMKFKKLCKIIFNVIIKTCGSILSIQKNIFYRILTVTRNNQRINLVHSNERDIDDQRLCVICQVNYKEVIIFPCRHICLCVFCNAALLENQNTCPICRTKIRETFKVYF